MAYNQDILTYHQSAQTGGTVAATVTLIASIASTTLSMYITSLSFSNGPSQGSVLLGYHTGGGTAPTGSAILFPAHYIAANTSYSPDLGGPLRIPAFNNVVVTAVSTTAFSVFCTYYVAP